MTYGIELTAEQKKYIKYRGAMPTWQIVELTIKRVSAMFEYDYRIVFSHKGKFKSVNCNSLCAFILKDYIAKQDLYEMLDYSETYMDELCKVGARLHMNSHAIQAAVTSIHHDIKYNIPWS